MRQAFSLPYPMQHWVHVHNLSYHDSISFFVFFFLEEAGRIARS